MLLPTLRMPRLGRWISVAGVLGALALGSNHGLVIGDTLAFNRSGDLWSALILGLLLLILLLFNPNRHHPIRSDHYALLLFSTVGALILARYTHVVTLFFGLEILSIPLYVLAAQTHSDRSHESSLKYFISGAFSSAVMIFGIALWYSASGTLSIAPVPVNTVGLVGTVLMMAALLFKVGLVPFHFWVPDVYDGAPAPYTAYMASVAKVAAVAALLHFTIISHHHWMITLPVVGAVSIILGSLGALKQRVMKRMLAYSSIAQAGFWILALASGFTALYFGLAYAIASILLFWIIDVIEDETQSHSLKGLMSRNRVLGLTAIVTLLSLTGIPPLAGFYAKYLVIFNLIGLRQYGIVAIALLSAIVGAYYYLKHVGDIITPSESQPVYISAISTVAATLAVAALLIIGLIPGVLGGALAYWI